jgi:hypothetical protein
LISALLSPLLKFSVVIAVATVLLNLAKLNDRVLFRVDQWRVTPPALALAIAGVLLVVGLAHTIVRYYGPAAAYVPANLLRGPVFSGWLAEDAAPAAGTLRDPGYQARSGYLRLIQDDTASTIKDLGRAGYDLIVFIDDPDRCSARTTAEVFEAINLFLSGTSHLSAKFVIGLDPAVVAAHLDTIYEKLDSHLALHGDDPSPGWAFLRKVVQLPVTVPRVADVDMERFVAAVLDVPEAALRRTATPAIITADGPDSPQLVSAESSVGSEGENRPPAREHSRRSSPRTGSV